ncbi:MAG: hypothetical protein K0R12_503 [Gammaproteobacteria bacterium]|nr:hypothetical protein [Gammaproteobacteria bacterium]
MKKIQITLILVLSFFYSVILSAQPAATGTWPSLNTITYQVVQEGWANSQTAEVTVAIDGNLDQAKLDRIQQDIQTKLQQVALNVDWRITVFQRDKSNSGLEQVHVEASARLPLAALGSIRAAAKKVSVQGETFTVQNIDYSPSTAEIEAVHADLRNSIYAEVKPELARLSKLYPDQSYYLHQIDFNTVLSAPSPRMMLATATPQAEAGGANDLLSQRIVETATVVLASNSAQIQSREKSDTTSALP